MEIVIVYVHVNERCKRKEKTRSMVKQQQGKATQHMHNYVVTISISIFTGGHAGTQCMVTVSVSVCTGQLEGGNTFFQFLKSDVPGDTVAIETEDETYLCDVEGVEPRTLHFQLLTEEDAGDCDITADTLSTALSTHACCLTAWATSVDMIAHVQHTTVQHAHVHVHV